MKTLQELLQYATDATVVLNQSRSTKDARDDAVVKLGFIYEFLKEAEKQTRPKFFTMSLDCNDYFIPEAPASWYGLTNGYGGGITSVTIPVPVCRRIYADSNGGRYIDCIREARRAWGLGLKDAKFLIDEIKANSRFE